MNEKTQCDVNDFDNENESDDMKLPANSRRDESLDEESNSSSSSEKSNRCNEAMKYSNDIKRPSALVVNHASEDDPKNWIMNFPLKLHHMLKEAEKLGYDHIISWRPHGRCFGIHKRLDFVNAVLPMWFRQSTIASFRRQLNLYGFKRLTKGLDKNCYYHPEFLRGMESLSNNISRTRIKGLETTKSESSQIVPNFYNLPFLPPIDVGKIGHKQQQDPRNVELPTILDSEENQNATSTLREVEYTASCMLNDVYRRQQLLVAANEHLPMQHLHQRFQLNTPITNILQQQQNYNSFPVNISQQNYLSLGYSRPNTISTIVNDAARTFEGNYSRTLSQENQDSPIHENVNRIRDIVLSLQSNYTTYVQQPVLQQNGLRFLFERLQHVNSLSGQHINIYDPNQNQFPFDIISLLNYSTTLEHREEVAPSNLSDWIQSFLPSSIQIPPSYQGHEMSVQDRLMLENHARDHNLNSQVQQSTMRQTPTFVRRQHSINSSEIRVDSVVSGDVVTSASVTSTPILANNQYINEDMQMYSRPSSVEDLASVYRSIEMRQHANTSISAETSRTMTDSTSNCQLHENYPEQQQRSTKEKQEEHE